MAKLFHCQLKIIIIQLLVKLIIDLLDVQDHNPEHGFQFNNKINFKKLYNVTTIRDCTIIRGCTIFFE